MPTIVTKIFILTSLFFGFGANAQGAAPSCPRVQTVHQALSAVASSCRDYACTSDSKKFPDVEHDVTSFQSIFGKGPVDKLKAKIQEFCQICECSVKLQSWPTMIDPNSGCRFAVDSKDPQATRIVSSPTFKASTSKQSNAEAQEWIKELLMGTNDVGHEISDSNPDPGECSYYTTQTLKTIKKNDQFETTVSLVIRFGPRRSGTVFTIRAEAERK